MAAKPKQTRMIKANSAPLSARAIRLDNGAVVYIRSSAARSLTLIPTDFSAVSPVVEGIASAFVETWKRIKPNKASVEFGLQLEAGTGKLISIFADGKGTAHLTVTLEWAASEPGSASASA